MQDAALRARYGLTELEAAKRLERYGPNEIAESHRVSPITLLFRQFRSLLIIILLIGAALAAALGETIDAIAILLVVVLNGVLGFVQEWRAENALAALRRMLTTEARVVRDGHQAMVDARLIVPGDLVILESGDKVPADLDLVSAMQLKLDESVLTGESVPVDKTAGGEEARLFMGSSVVRGRCEGVVVATGKNTEFGQIAELTASIGTGQTHLQVELGRLSRLLGVLAVAIAGLVMAAGLLVGRPLEEMFLTAIALSVAMVPEGLPAVVTITLALGASAMLRRHALVRRLQAVEALGATTVICTDKTGTLTENAMTVTSVWTATRDYEVSGTGYDPAGFVAAEGARVRTEDDPSLAEVIAAAASCNNAQLYRADEAWRMVGDPTEGALLTLAFKAWAAIPDPEDRVSELPFDSARKRMSVVTRQGSDLVQFVKGAPEAVLAVCSAIRTAPEASEALTETRRRQVMQTTADLASKGLRVLAVADRRVDAVSDHEEDLTFLGLIGMIDPPRPEVGPAIGLCRDAGIRVVMITGDDPNTARAIAESIGLTGSRVITGDELDHLTDPELEELIEQPVHFARTAPVHKMRLVDGFQDRGDLVAMTGDGVNDAPALRQADIGVAMGIRGTDVAKDASDLVLLDDNFATIVNAVEEGRRQFANIQRFVRYLLASNAGEVVAIVVNLFLGGPLIFLATQILWMNLVTDSVTAVALGMEKPAPDQMNRPPLPKDNPILDRAGLLLIACFGAYTGAASLWLFYTHLPLGEDVARTMAFTGMVLFEKVSVLAFRSFRLPMHRIGYFSNPPLLLALFSMLALQLAAIYWAPLQAMLHTVPLSLDQLGLIALLALPLLVVPEVVKILRSGRSAPVRLAGQA